MRALGLLCLVVIVGCNRAPPKAAAKDASTEPVGHLDWSTISDSSKGEIRQFSFESGACKVEGLLKGTLVWTSANCIANTKQLRFVSPDAERLMMIDPLPEIEKGLWPQAIGVSLFERGAPVRNIGVGELVFDAEKVRKTQRYVRWVQGTNDIAGLPPAYILEGTAVHLETVDNNRYDLRFDLGSGRIPNTNPVTPGSMTMKTMYQYGRDQFAETLADVPKKFRGKAKKVQMRSLAGKAGANCKPDPKDPTIYVCP